MMLLKGQLTSNLWLPSGVEQRGQLSNHLEENLQRLIEFENHSIEGDE
jgi:hypothetical protein